MDTPETTNPATPAAESPAPVAESPAPTAESPFIGNCVQSGR